MLDNFKNVYSSLVVNFFEECIKENIEERVQKEHPSIFIPGVGESYENIKPKVLYIGIDNNGWRDLAKDINEYKLVKDNEDEKNVFLDEIVKFSSKCLNNKEPFKKWYSSFWKFVIETQEALFNEYGIQATNVRMDENVLKTSFAWANTNSMELFSHIKNEDKTIYNYIKDKSKEFDSLNIILQALEQKTDLVIILNWSEEVDYLGMEIIDEEKQDEKHLQYYRAKNNDVEVQVIWTAHPRYLSANGGSNYYIKQIIQIIKEK